MDNMPKLVISGIAHDLAEDLVTIGRGPDNTIIISDPSVSGHHAQLELAGETYRLKDLDSTNGTRVNGVPITNTTLRFDDRIRFGAVVDRFATDARGAATVPPADQTEADSEPDCTAHG